jgi:predicted nucleotidyltransferase
MSHGAIIGARDGALGAVKGAFVGAAAGFIFGVGLVYGAGAIAAVTVPTLALAGISVQFATVIYSLLILGHVGATGFAFRNLLYARDGYEVAASISDILFAVVGWGLLARGYFRLSHSAAPTRTGEITGVTAGERAALANAFRGVQVEGKPAVLSTEVFGSRAGSTYRGRHNVTNSDLDVFVTLDAKVVNSAAKLRSVLQQINEIAALWRATKGYPLQPVVEVEPVAPAVKAGLKDTPFIKLDPPAGSGTP